MLRHHQALDHVLMLLRYHRPGLDHLPTGERANLVADACAHTNARLEALRKLVAYLEHGRLNYREPAATKVAGRDIKAAVLRDVDGLSNCRIAEVLCMNVPADYLIKGDHPKVRKMVRRGRSALVAALGEEGWRDQAQAMKDEAQRWHRRSQIQRRAELEAEALSVPYEEVLKHLQERQPSSIRDERGIREGVVF